MKQRFRVGGMSCAACSAHVEKSVSAVPGVSGVQVNLLAGSMAVEYDENACDAQTIVKAVESGGYTAAVDDGRQTSAPAQSPQADEALKEMKTRIIVSAIFMLVLMYFSMGEMVGLPLPSYAAGMDGMFNLALTELLLTLSIVIINRKYYINGFKTLLHRAPTMDALIAVGSGAALVYGIYALIQIALAPTPEAAHSFMHDLYFESAGMILTLVTLGKFFEARAKRKTGEAIAALMDLRPQTAEVIRGGQTMQLPIEQVQVGDLVIVRGGQSVPVDGKITEGSAYLDESAITGESMPVEKHVGDIVIGATVSKSGYVVMKALRVGDDTTLSQIIRLVEEAGASKAPIAKLADKVARRVCAGCYGDCARDSNHLAAGRRNAELCAHTRDFGAGHLVPVRTGTGNAGRYHGRHRCRCENGVLFQSAGGARESAQRKRGHHGQDRYRNRRPSGRNRRKILRRGVG